ncbi:hypothetical protein QF039_006716 [Pseudomonas sp. W2I6]|jgi:hypothetical protein|nr:hypothetical protein [Pseudomonas sp. W2I6]
MARAINKNKKPETNNKNRARNYFWGSFGSPCSFRDLAPATLLLSFWLKPCS